MFKRGQTPKKSLKIGEARRINVFYEPSSLESRIMVTSDGKFDFDDVYEGMVIYNSSTNKSYVYSQGAPIEIMGDPAIPK